MMKSFSDLQAMLVSQPSLGNAPRLTKARLWIGRPTPDRSLLSRYEDGFLGSPVMLSLGVTLLGVRIGEAANAGPEEVNFVIAVSNPTTVLNKAESLLKFKLTLSLSLRQLLPTKSRGKRSSLLSLLACALYGGRHSLNASTPRRGEKVCAVMRSAR